MLNRLLYSGVVSPPPQLGGVHTASNPAPPADCAVTVVPATEATSALLVTIEIPGALATVKLFSSIISAWTVLVSLTFRVTDSVGMPAGSPLRCRMILTGKQLLNGAAGELTAPRVAITPPRPGLSAVANPLLSTDTAFPQDCVQPKLPTRLVMSTPLLNAWALNWAVVLLELHAGKTFPVTCVTWMEVTTGWTDTRMGALLTPPAVAVI